MTVPCVHLSVVIHKSWLTQPGIHPVGVCVCVRGFTRREKEGRSQRTVCLFSWRAFHLSWQCRPQYVLYHSQFLPYISRLARSLPVSLEQISACRDSVYSHFISFFAEPSLDWGLSCARSIMGLCFRDNQTSPPNADTEITDWII